MVLEQSATQPFFQWLQLALSLWLIVLGVTVCVALVGASLVVIFRRGPVAGLQRVEQVLWQAAIDLVCVSPRRVAALSWLAVREAIRRRDASDLERSDDPLQIAPGAEVVDTTGLSIEQVIDKLADLVKREVAKGSK